MLFYLIALIVFILDQATKWMIVNNMQVGDAYSVIGNFFQITSHRNPGAAFGILEDQRWFFVVITIIIVAGIIWYLNKMIKERRKRLPFALSLLLGGALGNFVDRLLFGEVVDFLQFHFQFTFLGLDVDYIYPIFNVADSSIVVGVILIFVDTFIAWRREKKGLTS